MLLSVACTQFAQDCTESCANSLPWLHVFKILKKGALSKKKSWASKHAWSLDRTFANLPKHVLTMDYTIHTRCYTKHQEVLMVNVLFIESVNPQVIILWLCSFYQLYWVSFSLFCSLWWFQSMKLTCWVSKLYQPCFLADQEAASALSIASSKAPNTWQTKVPILAELIEVSISLQSAKTELNGQHIFSLNHQVARNIPPNECCSVYKIINLC